MLNLTGLDFPDFHRVMEKELSSTTIEYWKNSLGGVEKAKAIKWLEGLLKISDFFSKVEFSDFENLTNRESNKHLLEEVRSDAKLLLERCNEALYWLVSPKLHIGTSSVTYEGNGQVVKVTYVQINDTIRAAKKFVKDSSRFDFALAGVMANFSDLFKVFKAFSL